MRVVLVHVLARMASQLLADLEGNVCIGHRPVSRLQAYRKVSRRPVFRAIGSRHSTRYSYKSWWIGICTEDPVFLCSNVIVFSDKSMSPQVSPPVLVCFVEFIFGSFSVVNVIIAYEQSSFGWQRRDGAK